MKLQKTLPIALVLSVVMITLTGLSSTASAQDKAFDVPQINAVTGPCRPPYMCIDSGIITLGVNEILRTIVNQCDRGAGPGGGPVVKFTSRTYEATPGVRGVLSQTSEETTSTPGLRPSDGAIFDLLLPSVPKFARVLVENRSCTGEDDNSGGATFEVVDAATGKVKYQKTGHVSINR